MKTSIATMALLGSLAGGTALAQQAANPAAAPASAPAAAPAPNSDPNAPPNVQVIPEPTPADELRAPTIALPNDPIEPYLLTKENGPFMVLAKVFRGPDSQQLALALAKELREQHGLPAYILRSKDWPGRSNIRGIPPTADPMVAQASVGGPEKIRTYDEAAVLVGNEKTEHAATALQHKVKKIRPKTLDGVSSIFPWREGLSKAIRTTNPYVPAQELYPRKPDRLIVQMNSGHNSIANHPGGYSLQVAQFTGRTTFDERDENFRGVMSLRNSPLRTAADDAERMAAILAKDKDVQKLGQPVYVYHDRTSSRVYVGSFPTDNDPRAVAVRDELLKLALPLMDSNARGKAHLDTMIAPAAVLTDVNAIKAGFQQ